MTRWQFSRACPNHGRMVFFPMRPDGQVDGSDPHCDRCRKPLSGRRDPITLEADRWFDARAVAMAEFHTDELTWLETTAEPEIRLTWEGTDAGRVPLRRMVVNRLPDRSRPNGADRSNGATHHKLNGKAR